MKNWTFLLILFAITSFSFAQNCNLSALQGLKDQDGNIMLEISGYEVFIESLPGNVYDKNTISYIKSLYNIDHVINESSSSDIKTENQIIEGEVQISTQPLIKSSQACYVLKKSETDIHVVFFLTTNNRKPELELCVVQEFLSSGLTSYLLSSNSAKSFSFAGRQISLEQGYTWYRPHNIQGEGVQLSWSEFLTFTEANADNNNRFRLDSNEMKILSDEELEVIFENKPTMSRRVVYNIENNPYPLVVYYVVQEVRGKYLSCALSNYVHDKNDYQLDPLLQKVMRQNITGGEREEGPATTDHVTSNKYDLFELQLGVRTPIGNLSSRYGFAPALSLYTRILRFNSMALDFGFQGALSVQSKRFELQGIGEEAKTIGFFNMNLRLRRQLKLSPDLYFQYYGGIGYEYLVTDVEKESFYYYDDEGNEKEYTSHYGLPTFDLFGGCSFKHKHMGVYVEYHYSPYSLSTYATSNFGHSALNVGLLFSF